MAAEKGHSPDDSQQVRNAHLEMHAAVMDLFRRSRPQMRKHMPEYWSPLDESHFDDDGELDNFDGAERAVLFMDGPSIDESEQLIVGLKSLEMFQGATNTFVEHDSPRHRGTVSYSIYEPVILPPDGCRRVVDLIGEALEELGYMDVPQERRTLHVMDGQGGATQAQEGGQ